MKKNYCIAALMGAFLFIAPTSCSNENEEIDESQLSDKVVFDNKGEVETDEDIEVSTLKMAQKDGLKVTGVGFYDIRVLHSKSNNLPDSFYEDGGTFYKLDIDLNAGAGGEWVYLYYRWANSVETPVTNWVGFASYSSRTEKNLHDYINSSNFTPFANVKDYGFVTDRDDIMVDFNQGAGGKYVYMGQTKNNIFAPITNFKVKSTTKDYTYTRSFVENGCTYYSVLCWNSILDKKRRDIVGQTLDFNLDTKKHNRYIYILYTRD